MCVRISEAREERCTPEIHDVRVRSDCGPCPGALADIADPTFAHRDRLDSRPSIDSRVDWAAPNHEVSRPGASVSCAEEEYREHNDEAVHDWAPASAESDQFFSIVQGCDGAHGGDLRGLGILAERNARERQIE